VIQRRNATMTAFAGALGGLAGCGDPPPTAPATDAAVERIARPEAHLRSFLLRHAYGSNAVLLNVHRLGREAGCTAIRDAVEASVAKHLPTWRTRLVASYREQVPPAELAAAARSSPDSADRKLREHSDAIWRSMGRKNRDDPIGTASKEVAAAVAARAERSPARPAPGRREFQELRYETIGGEICPNLQAAFRVEDQ
jgi:hypothetical protein